MVIVRNEKEVKWERGRNKIENSGIWDEKKERFQKYVISLGRHGHEYEDLEKYNDFQDFSLGNIGYIM